MRKTFLNLVCVLAAVALMTACASRPAGTNLADEGQTLGGYVATGAVDPDNTKGTRNTGDDDQTPDGAPESDEEEKETPPPPPMR